MTKERFSGQNSFWAIWKINITSSLVVVNAATDLILIKYEKHNSRLWGSTRKHYKNTFFNKNDRILNSCAIKSKKWNISCLKRLRQMNSSYQCLYYCIQRANLRHYYCATIITVITLLLKNLYFKNADLKIYLYLYLSDFFSVCNINMSNLKKTQNAIKFFNVYQILTDIKDKLLNRLCF